MRCTLVESQGVRRAFKDKFTQTTVSKEFIMIAYELFIVKDADVAELADALDLGSSIFDVQVRFLSSAFQLDHDLS